MMAADQEILDEDVDEAYEPTKQGEKKQQALPQVEL
jgi:hypothetical protein